MNSGSKFISLLFIGLLSVVLLSACVTQTTKAPVKTTVNKSAYTQQEQNKLTQCVSLSNSAMHAATQKLKAVPILALKQNLSNLPDKSTQWAIVDKVYKADFNNAWQYSEGFFVDCALNTAGIAKSRMKVASYCMQNQLIAGVAHLFRIQGKPVTAAKAYFAKVNNRVINDIVESVYQGKDNRVDTQMNIWNSCITTVPE